MINFVLSDPTPLIFQLNNICYPFVNRLINIYIVLIKTLQ